MSEWKETMLGDFISLQRGHDLPTHERRHGSIPVVGSGGITGFHDTAMVTGPGLTIGRAANLGIPTLTQEDFWPLNTTLFVTDFHGNDVRFTYHLLQTLDLTGFNSGSVQPMLNRNYIRNFPIRVPTPKLQRAIAAVLGVLDDKIAVNDRIEFTYEEIFRTRFDELEIDIEPEPANAVRADGLIEFNPRLPAPHSSEAVHLEMSAVPTTRARVQEWSIREPKYGTRFANGDTVMARITPCLENGKTAFIDFMTDGEVGMGSTEFIVMRARTGIPTHLPYFLARSPRFQTHAVRNMVGSSGRQRVGASQLVDFPLSRPETDRLSAFGEAASIAFNHMKSLGSESRSLRQLRDTLLPRLMSGEIRVRDAEKVVEEVS